MFGICNLGIVPVRLEPSDKSEQITQLLFGEHFSIIEQRVKWTKIKIYFDGYEGWIDNNQFKYITEEQFISITKTTSVLSSDFVEFIITKNNNLLPIPLGSELCFIKNTLVNTENYQFEGTYISGILPKENIIKTAFTYLNTPYLWGGKTPFGIDCSGFTQMVYKLNGYTLLRDASEQATQGEALSFIEESTPGDLAFFDNDDGTIVHVGIIMADNYIIHASGKVRIDRLDHLGIYNTEKNRHTHKLRVIKKII